MTNEKVLKLIEDGCIVPIQIKANDETSTKYNLENLEAINMIIKALKQESCEDCISRQAVLDCLKATKLKQSKKFDLIIEIRNEVMMLPPVILKPKSDVLDKIRDEIEQLPTSECRETCRIYIEVDDFKENVLEIIDKYRESEG
jgi:hypothetical protein